MWWGGRLFEAGRLLTFSAFRMGAYSRWALIRGWALIRIKLIQYLIYPLHSNIICLAPVVQKLDNAIHRINHYPVEKYYGNQ